MPDPRASRIDAGPFQLEPATDGVSWRAVSSRGADAPVGTWEEWLFLAQRIVRVDALWREVEARGDAWDEGFAAARDAAAINPYR